MRPNPLSVRAHHTVHCALLTSFLRSAGRKPNMKYPEGANTILCRMSQCHAMQNESIACQAGSDDGGLPWSGLDAWSRTCNYAVHSRLDTPVWSLSGACLLNIPVSGPLQRYSIQ